MPRVYWVCPDCGHEALDYDEVDHDCYIEETGETKNYVAQGDERAIDEDYGQER